MNTLDKVYIKSKEPTTKAKLAERSNFIFQTNLPKCKNNSLVFK